MGFPWSVEDIEKLRELAPKMDKQELSKVFKRTPNACYVKAKQIGVQVANRHWQEHEVKYLKDNTGKVTLADAAKHLGRDKGPVQSKANRLGVSFFDPRVWTREDEDWLRANCQTSEIDQLANHLGRTDTSVRKKLDKMGLHYKRKVQYKTWTQEELDFIKANRTNMLADEIAHHLNRTRIAVVQIASKHEIKLRQRTGGLKTKVGEEFIPWSKEEDQQLWSLSERFTLRQIAEQLPGRTRGAVFNRCKKLGISLRQGKLNNKIVAKHLGFKVSLFHRYKKLCGLDFLTMENPKNPTEEELNQIIDRIRSNERSILKFSRAKMRERIRELPL